ncbi:uncharacterized protein LOC132916980 isoform X1 [Rhopalosiphum padi]|uniref:uncharacterized protein LOC132916980 isoform X1 n=1 Tax=Rhopalosiphum padi TaxID=40932 RepID=UPI00298E2ED8|nr:uncharacterized protein LOC132916980 isoform X1 [Rhopalosiphum padi]
MSKFILVMTFVYAVLCSMQKNAFHHVDAAPSITRDDLTAVLPGSLTELFDSEAFERIWRKAAADQMVKRFGDGAGRDGGATTRNMIGDYMVTDEFHQAVCKAGGQGMSSMGGMMGNAPPPWSYMGTFIGSDKFQHGTCDMMSQGLIQFGEGMNGWFRSADADATAAALDPLRAVDAFFRSEHYDNAREKLRDMFSDVRF